MNSSSTSAVSPGQKKAARPPAMLARPARNTPHGNGPARLPASAHTTARIPSASR